MDIRPLFAFTSGCPPFNMEFYRQFVRGTYDNGAPYAVFRWMEAPRFYLKTVDQAGRPIEPEVLAVVREALPRAVREFSAGTLTAAALESGPESRESATSVLIIARWPRVTCRFAASSTPIRRACCAADR
jgi:hypothetical protein